ncbi:MAG TPA: CdaR family protein [Desulfobacteria bacterium]|nr:CdaR family protein [Desulfobacteria bacterium]
MDKGDRGLKVLSLLVAVVLWVYVSNELNPTKEREFRDVGVDIRGVASNLAVSEMPGSVRVRVKASQDVISGLNAGSIEVFADLKNVKMGKNLIPLEVQAPAGVQVVDLKPQQATIKVEPLAEKQVPIKVRFKESPSKGYKVGTVQTKPDDVIVRGPKSIVDGVSFAVVDIDITNKQKSFGETVPDRVTNDLGTIIEEGLIKRIPPMVDVFVSIVPDLPSKKVPVIPLLTGEPSPGHAVTMTVIDPPELVVTGKYDILEGVSQIATKAIDITGAQSDLYIDIAPDMPSGVVANRQSLKVLIKIGKE